MASAINGMPIKRMTNNCVKEKGRIQEDDEEREEEKEEEEFRTSKRR
jgi:hypothetical protein